MHGDTIKTSYVDDLLRGAVDYPDEGELASDEEQGVSAGDVPGPFAHVILLFSL